MLALYACSSSHVTIPALCFLYGVVILECHYVLLVASDNSVAAVDQLVVIRCWQKFLQTSEKCHQFIICL